jgi:cyclopropane fatty-acyl-phospholipid synthase-like methyltransferase
MENKNIHNERDYWDGFYKDWAIDIPSQFCVLVATEINSDDVIVEFGCGNGRDALYMAEHNYKVVAMDLSHQAIKKDKLVMSEMKGKSIKFLQGDVADEGDVIRAINLARGVSVSQRITVYTRFFMHTLDADQEDMFIEILDRTLNKEDRVYFEFRSIEDKDNRKIFDKHYRRYIDTNAFVEKLKSKYNFNILYEITGQGMAKYMDEDPFVSRVVIKR